MTERTKLISYLLYGFFSAFLKKNTIRTPEVNFHIRLRAPWLSSSLILKCFCVLVFLSFIENIVVPPFDHLFCCFGPRARCFYLQLKRAEKSFIMPGHYKKIMPTPQPIRAGVLLKPYNISMLIDQTPDRTYVIWPFLYFFFENVIQSLQSFFLFLTF